MGRRVPADSRKSVQRIEEEMRAGLAGSLAIALMAGLSAPHVRAHALRTITIDGDLADWTEVLLDRDQKASDPSAAQGDPDAPGQAQRDERGAAFTWDASRFYLWFS